MVDNTNFLDKADYSYQPGPPAAWRAPSAALHTVERFTRVADDTLDYQLTMEDPIKFTRPLTVAFSLTQEASVFFE